jgi:hypothetical protein
MRMNDREHAAWQGFLTLHATLTEEIDRSLRETHGLTLQHFEVLLHLDRAPGNRMRMGDLATSVRLSQSGTSRLVDPVTSFVRNATRTGGSSMRNSRRRGKLSCSRHVPRMSRALRAIS